MWDDLNNLAVDRSSRAVALHQKYGPCRECERVVRGLRGLLSEAPRLGTGDCGCAGHERGTC